MEIIWDVFSPIGRCWFHRSPNHPVILGWGMVQLHVNQVCQPCQVLHQWVAWLFFFHKTWMKHDFFRESHNKITPQKVFFLNGFSQQNGSLIKWSRFNSLIPPRLEGYPLAVSFSLKNILIPRVCDFWCLQVSSNWISYHFETTKIKHKQYSNMSWVILLQAVFRGQFVSTWKCSHFVSGTF